MLLNQQRPCHLAKNKLLVNGAGIFKKAPKNKAKMKRYGNLFNFIICLENLSLAYTKAKQGKTKTYGVRLFEKERENNLIQLRNELETGLYVTSQYSVFTIYEPKERIIYRLPFRDRVVHHAIMNVLEPIWVSLFIQNSYACIKKRGIHLVLNHIKRDLKDVVNTRFCLKIDIKKFYPSIDHEILKTILRKKIKDVKLLNLLDSIIDSAPGVPIGNYLSQYFANLYLTYFDHWVKEDLQVKYYYRYADDIVVLHASKSELWSLFAKMDQYLSNNLKLEIKPNYQVFPVDVRGVDFVGYVFRHTHVRLRKSIKKNMCRKAAKLNKRDIDAKTYKMAISSHTGWAKHCNSKNLLKKILNEKIL